MFKLKDYFISTPKPCPEIARRKNLHKDNKQNSLFIIEPFLRRYGSD